MPEPKDERPLPQRLQDAMEEIGELAFQYSDAESAAHQEGLARALQILRKHVPDGMLR